MPHAQGQLKGNMQYVAVVQHNGYAAMTSDILGSIVNIERVALVSGQRDL